MISESPKSARGISVTTGWETPAQKWGQRPPTHRSPLVAPSLEMLSLPLNAPALRPRMSGVWSTLASVSLAMMQGQQPCLSSLRKR